MSVRNLITFYKPVRNYRTSPKAHLQLSPRAALDRNNSRFTALRAGIWKEKI